jgi:hypothetical protein
MNPEIFSILINALERAGSLKESSRKSRVPSTTDKKVLVNLQKSIKYKNCVKEHFIDEVTIFMNNDKDCVYAEIAKLSALNIGELRQVWKEKFGKEAPYNARKTMLLDKLVYCFREQAFGGLSDKAKERLSLLEERLKKGEPLRGKNYELAPGMIFTREYNNEKHTVKILDDGKVEYRGDIYRTLSTVASKICGCRWNGYKFFHVTKR